MGGFQCWLGRARLQRAPAYPTHPHLPSYLAPAVRGPRPNAHPPAPPPIAGGGNQRDKGGAVAIRQSYLRVVGFQEDVLNGDTARRPTFT